MHSDAGLIHYIRSKSHTYISVRSLLSACFIASVSFFLVVHFCIIYLENDALDDYSQRNFERVERLMLQVNAGFNMIADAQTRTCSDSMDVFKQIIKRYYFIDDMGRVDGNTVLCSVLNEKGVTLFTEPALDTMQDQMYALNPKVNANHREVFAFVKGDFFLSVSGAYLLEKVNFISKNGIGNIIHTPDNATIYDFHGDIDLNFVHQHFSHDSTNYVFDIEVTRCNTFLNFCTTSIDTSPGLWGKSNKLMALVIFLGILIGLAYSYVAWLRSNGLNSFFRELLSAIKKKDVFFVYQPQINMSDNSVVGVEVLARWESSHYGNVPPDVFIGAAELKSYIFDFTEVLLIKSLSELKQVLNKQALSISINIPPSVVINPEFKTILLENCEKNGIPFHLVVLEITEKTTTDIDTIVAACRLYSDLGFQISVDDFGTGFSNLSLLSKLCPDEIKIDKMFTQSIKENEVTSLTLSGILNMIDVLSLKKVFEGIENQEQFDFIKTHVPGAIGQGYFFSKPISRDKLLDFLETT